MDTFPPTARTTLHRLPRRGVYDKGEVYAILDEGFICHVGFAIDSQPYVIPTGYARSGDQIFLHGSAASRMLRSLASFTLFLRYQAQSERLYRRAVEEFERLKRLRRELPNEPILQAQPEPNQTTCPPGQTNPSNPSSPPKPSPAGNIPGQPPRFYPNGEPFLVPPRALPPEEPETPSADPNPPKKNP